MDKNAHPFANIAKKIYNIFKELVNSIKLASILYF